MTDSLTEAALCELLSLECRAHAHGAMTYHNSDGLLHRVYGPAIEYSDGSRAWWQNDCRHRIDGPAVEYSDGYRAWFRNGQRHRVDGPAIEYPGGYRAWFRNGQRHRVDGPAVEYTDGSCDWYVNGKKLTEAEWQQAVANMENV